MFFQAKVPYIKKTPPLTLGNHPKNDTPPPTPPLPPLKNEGPFQEVIPRKKIPNSALDMCFNFSIIKYYWTQVLPLPPHQILKSHPMFSIRVGNPAIFGLKN